MEKNNAKNVPSSSYQSTSTAPPPLPPSLKFHLYSQGSSSSVPAKRVKTDNPISFERFVNMTHAMKHKGRNMYLHKKSISEAAKMNGIETISHTSGAEFAIPLSMQAHPTKLTDTMPDERSDILCQTDAMPYCMICHSVVKTWQGYEYHILKEHIKYRAYRCISCPKETFFTEEEGRFHMSFHHPEANIALAKEFDKAKEEEAKNAFKVLLMMMRDGDDVTSPKVREIQNAQIPILARFSRLRFKIPMIVVRSRTVIDKVTQTQTATSNNYVPYGMIRPHFNHSSGSANLGISSRPTSEYTSRLQTERVIFRTARK